MFKFECTAKVIIQTEEKVLSEKEKALIALEVEQELNNIGYYETIEGKKIGIRCHFFREEEEMKNPKRISKILELIYQLWIKCPDQRLCQLVHNAVSKEEPNWHGRDQFYVEDDCLKRGLYKLLADNETQPNNVADKGYCKCPPPRYPDDNWNCCVCHKPFRR